jgi:hypothetical protein
MTDIEVRIPSLPPRLGGPGGATVAFKSNGRIGVNCAMMALDLVFALRRSLAYTFPVWAAETTLLLSHLSLPRSGPLALQSDFERGSLQVKRFVIESAGVCISAAVFRALSPTRPRQVLNLDVLPENAQWMAPKGKPRPDLAFEYAPDQWVAGEARARSDDAPLTLQKTQFDRTVQLDAWAVAAAALAPPGSSMTKWFMTWAWLTTNDTKVDFIDPGEPTPFVDPRGASEYQRQREDAIWETAPRAEFRVGDAEVRGRTISVTPVGTRPVPAWMFLGITASGDSFRESSDAETGIEAATAGRSVAAIGWDGEPAAHDLARVFSRTME